MIACKFFLFISKTLKKNYLLYYTGLHPFQTVIEMSLMNLLLDSIYLEC